MSFVSGTTGNEAAQKFLEVLQADFKNLGQETKKKYPQIKEVSDPKQIHNKDEDVSCVIFSCPTLLSWKSIVVFIDNIPSIRLVNI